MNKLNHQSGAKVIDATAVFAASRYAETGPGVLDEGLWANTRRLVVEQLVKLYSKDRSHAMTNLLRSLRGRLDWRGSSIKRYRTAVKYLIRALCMSRQHDAYLTFVFEHPRMSAYQRRDPRVLERHFHRYVHRQWDRHTRLRSIRQHYQFALTRLPGVLFEAIYVYGNAPLGNLTLKDGSQLKLCLRPPIFMGSEGELCIQLSDADDHPIYRIILNVIDDQQTLAIGCIQGPGGANAKDMVRDLTKNMYGMRPKQLMLSLAYAFAHHFGIGRLLAVSNAAHPLRKTRDRFQADYDSFWQEQKGEDIGNGWFLLPEAPSRKSESEVSSQHRSAFRRREALRLGAEQLLTEALESFPVHRVLAHTEEAVELEQSSRHDNVDVLCKR